MKKVVQNVLLYTTLLIVICMAMHMQSSAQQANGQTVIHLKSGTISLDENARQWIEAKANSRSTKEPIQVLVHFNKLPTKEQREVLQESGITLLEYIPDNTFSAIVQPSLNTERISALPLHSIINVQPEWKADDYLWNKVNSNKGAVEVMVSFNSAVDVNTIKQFIAGVGGRIDQGPMEHYGSYKVIIAASMVRAVASWYGVHYISPVNTAIVPLDLWSKPAVKANIATSDPVNGGYGLLGDGVTVGVGDDGSGIYHIDLVDRITNFCPGPPTHHGEHVNGIVGGAAIIDPIAVSMAPHVALLDYLYDFILPATGAMYRDYNMTITNNSYEIIAGDCSYAGTYDFYSQMVDTLEIEYPNVLHVFASGNDGYNTCSPFVPGFATVGGGYQPAKNALVVGSITGFYIQSPDESRGPVKDGRLKPEMVAVGLLVYSTIGYNQYEWAAGTSMAAPQVAGGLAEMTQRYRQLNAGAQPRADLLKAIAMNGATDMGNPGPDYTFGFGRLDMYHSLRILDNKWYTSNEISDGEIQSIPVTVPPNTGQLKVMIYWNDVPASPSASKALVNDIDLTVIDPSAKTHLPLVLDGTPANVNNTATEHPDHLNNVEQVTINNPAAGTYAVNTNGFSIPKGPQSYVVVYEIIPNELHLTFPLGGEQLSNADTTKLDSILVCWDAVTDANTFTVQISSNNGATWVTLIDTVAPAARFFPFEPTGFNSGNCLVRVMKNNTALVSTSKRFAINGQTVVNLDTAQCPGYININWPPVPNATSYYLLSKKGFYLQVVDSVAATSYSFRGMSLTDNSYVAVQPVINGMPGYRTVAAIVLANTGNCTNPVSAGDLMIQEIDSPVSGRMHTSTQLSAATNMQVKLRNLYTANCTNYTLSYAINGGAWQTVTNPGTIPAHNTASISIPGLNLAAQGRYDITVAVHNLDLTDPFTGNDTMSFTVQNLPNDTINLATPFFDGFEAMGRFSVDHDTIGVSPNAHWDFFTASDTGRMRPFVSDEVTITGNNSISLDENQATHTGSNNLFNGTFNLSNYDTANTEVRIDFDYLLAGTPKTAKGNFVHARANDTSAWSPLFTYDLTAYPGFVTNVKSLSLTDILRSTKKNFSTSCQVSFGQNDTSLIAAKNYGNGITLDNFNMYTVTNDAELVSIITPLPANCGLPASVPLTVQVHNGVHNTLHNMQLFYSIDGGATYTGVIDSLIGKSTINYTFPQQLNIAPGSTHNLNVWLKENGDSYTANDTILNYHIRNSQVISTYPYLENFESGDGGYYTDGFLSSWQYGTPATPKVNHAASGTKAWKTNLTGNYHNLEKSYLYSPCFDISRLTYPMLSFSIASSIENCGNTLCDAGYVEYSFDGATWRKLGAYGQGTNWYDSTFDVWNQEGFTRWHVASIAIPELGTGQTTHFRFVMAADPGVTFDGMAIDDVHVYDFVNPIAPASGTITQTESLNNNQWTDYLLSNKLLASLQPINNSISSATVTLYRHDTLSNVNGTQYTMPRSYLIQSPQAPNGATGVRLYLLDSEVVQVINDTTCPSCTRLTEAYSLGVTQYSNPGNVHSENNTLADDSGGAITYYPHNNITWVPYDKGYYAQLNVKPLSELWFNNGGPTGTFPATTDYLNFIAYRNGTNVATYWYSLIDTAVNAYTVQRSDDDSFFTAVTTVPARHVIPGEYTFVDTVNFTSDPVLYYRLKWTMADKDGNNYSPVRKITINDSGASMVMLNATMISRDDILVNWTSYVDAIASYYKLERAIGDGQYVNINNTNAAHLYGMQYSYTDQVTDNLPNGTPIHYRLTAIMEDGAEIVLPVKTLNWINGNSVINVYPNPTTDGNFTIAWNADAGTVMTINIFDALGRKMFETNVKGIQWNNTTALQTFRGPKGVYAMQIDIGGKRYSLMMVYE